MRVKAETIVVVAGGQPFVERLPEPSDVPDGSFLIAADGGVDRALALGLHVDVAIGDFDSVTATGLAAVEAAGARIERYPAAKDATDLELALDAAVALDPSRILVIGSSGGRLDHLLGSLLLLGDERYARVTIDAWLGGARAHVIRGSRTLAGTPGELLSLLPLDGAAEGVTTEGLEYPLHGETLAPGTSRGISNVFAAAEARITVAGGCLVAIRPAPDGEELL
jgi:thiamine pyrophosphokinase